MYRVAVGDDAHFVVLLEGDVTEHEGGVDGAVQQREATEGHLHGAAGVDQRDDLLRLLVLVLVHHQLGPARRGLPVHRATVIAGDVVAYLLELAPLRTAPHLAHAGHAEEVGLGHQLVFPQMDVAGVYRDLAALFLLIAPLGQTPACACQHIDRAVGINATGERPHHVRELCLRAAGNAPPQVQAALLQLRRQLVQHPHMHGEAVAVAHLHGHGVLIAVAPLGQGVA